MENHRHTHRTHTIVLPFATVLRVVCVCVCFYVFMLHTISTSISARIICGMYLNLAMSLDVCTMFSTGFLPSRAFRIGSLPWSAAAYLVFLLCTFLIAVVLSLVL